MESEKLSKNKRLHIYLYEPTIPQLKYETLLNSYIIILFPRNIPHLQQWVQNSF